MKKIFKVLNFLMLLALPLLSACSDDDTKVVNIGIPEAAREANDAGVNQMTITLKDNETKQISIHLQPVEAKNKDYFFEIKNGGVFSITDGGLISPIAIGQDTLIVHSADGGASTSFRVKVITHIVKVTSLTIASDALNLNLETGKTYALSAKITINPSDASDKSLKYISSDPSKATVDENTGVITGIAEGEAVITITAADGSGVKTQSYVNVIDKYVGPVDHDRSGWVVTTSVSELSDGAYEYVPDGTTGKPEHMFDGDGATFLSIVKPGKSYATGGVTYVTPVGHELYFIIDMKQKLNFEYIKWAHRANNGNDYLRVWGIDLYGSDDGTAFSLIQSDIAIQHTDNAAAFIIDLASAAECRYIKVHITKWSDNSGGSTSGSTVQTAEFGVGYYAL